MVETRTEAMFFGAERASGRPFDPPSAYRELRREEPITRVNSWGGSTPWLVTGYAETRAVLSDPRVSVNPTHSGFPHPSEAFQVRRSEETHEGALHEMDDPEHGRVRRMMTAPFGVKRIEAFRPTIQQTVDELIDEMLAGPKPVDLVQAFALPVPARLLCGLLGVPYSDHEFFQHCTKTIFDWNNTVEQVLGAQDNLFKYFQDLVDHVLAEPDDGLLSQLAIERVATGELTRDDLARHGLLLLAAGENITNMITLGTVALLEHPDQLAALRDTDNPKLVASAVEELLRYLTVVHAGLRRVALADIEIGGQMIKAGEGLILAIQIANRDPDIFADPDRLDIHRDARPHVAFGFGIHQCLAQTLARAELEVAYGTLFQRIPRLRLATDIAELRFRNSGNFYGLYELPVDW